jgi:predicted amidohydrolase
MKIALIQFTGRREKTANIDKAVKLVEKAASQGAVVVCLHELASTIYFPFEENPSHFGLAETIPGETTELFSAICRAYHLVLVLPMFEEVGRSYYFNSAAVIGPQGEILGVYRKSSIPLVRLTPGRRGTAFEKYYFRPGDLGFPVFETPLNFNIGTMICFDRHYPEHFRVLALDGAHLICVPTTAPRGKGIRAWLFELQAAAYVNSCWVAGVNRVGWDEGGSPEEWFGRSVLIDPTGKIVAEASDKDEEILIADFNPQMADVVRQARGFVAARKPESYAALVR